MTKTISTVLVTGANVGLGFEASRQLALKEGVTRVILGCRNPAKGEAAKKDLEAATNKNVFEILIIDVSDLESVSKAASEVKGLIDGLVLNAGGSGGADGAEMTKYGVTSIMAVNVLGHVDLVDLLLKEKKLSPDASIVYSGTEAIRGVPTFNMPKPDLKSGSVEEFTSICDSSYFGDDKTMEAMYGTTKLVGAMWMSSMARKQPEMRFVTMSPGGTTGTTFARDLPWYKQAMFATMMTLMELFGQMHSLQKGALRYVDALYDDDLYKSGVTYASKKGVTGEVADQKDHLPILADEKYQDNANVAVHKFIK